MEETLRLLNQVIIRTCLGEAPITTQQLRNLKIQVKNQQDYSLRCFLKIANRKFSHGSSRINNNRVVRRSKWQIHSASHSSLAVQARRRQLTRPTTSMQQHLARVLSSSSRWREDSSRLPMIYQRTKKIRVLEQEALSHGYGAQLAERSLTRDLGIVEAGLESKTTPRHLFQYTQQVRPIMVTYLQLTVTVRSPAGSHTMSKAAKGSVTLCWEGICFWAC